MKPKKTNTNKGITLIALVITVIVLLILAGTAINIAVNGNNIFAKANTAVESYNAKAAEQEAAILALNTQFENYYKDYDPNQGPSLPAGWSTTAVAMAYTDGTTIPRGLLVSCKL